MTKVTRLTCRLCHQGVVYFLLWGFSFQGLACAVERAQLGLLINATLSKQNLKRSLLTHGPSHTEAVGAFCSCLHVIYI